MKDNAGRTGARRIFEMENGARTFSRRRCAMFPRANWRGLKRSRCPYRDPLSSTVKDEIEATASRYGLTVTTYLLRLMTGEIEDEQYSLVSCK